MLQNVEYLEFKPELARDARKLLGTTGKVQLITHDGVDLLMFQKAEPSEDEEKSGVTKGLTLEVRLLYEEFKTGVDYKPWLLNLINSAMLHIDDDLLEPEQQAYADGEQEKPRHYHPQKKKGQSRKKR